MRIAHLKLIILTIVLLSTLYAARQVDNDYGQISVRKVTIPNGTSQITGIIYSPKLASPNNRLPAVALAHGIAGAKDYVCDIALEAARNGFIAVAIDLDGHGESGGTISEGDPSLGLTSVLNWLEQQPNVDSSKIAVGGHSLGAGAARGAAYAYKKNVATILIAGGIGSQSEGEGYGVLNNTFPGNLLFVVGSEDILFNVTQLKETLKPVFGVNGGIESGKTYGDVANLTGRRLVLLSNIHSFEPLDPTAVREVVGWLQLSFYPHQENTFNPKTTSYPIRDVLLLVALASYIGLVAPLTEIFGFLIPGSLGPPIKARNRFLRERIALIGWGILGVITFIPSMLLGFILPYPALVFGASQAWWFLITGILGLIFLTFLARRANVRWISEVRKSVVLRDIILGAALFVATYVIALAIGYAAEIRLKIIVPVFIPLTSIRAAMFPQFIPFYLVYFVVEGLWLHIYRTRQHSGNPAVNYMRTLSIKVVPYLALIVLQYGSMFLFGVAPLPGFLGFFIEFLWGIVPLFAVSTFISWWLYRYTGRVWMGALLNALLFAWLSAGLFPFGTFG
jgi:dienelactone hydrolase